MRPAQEWATPEGAPVALQCVVDLLGNLCNADDPARLPLVRSRVPPLVTDSRLGPAVDLDALLLTLLEDIVTGTLGSAVNHLHGLEFGCLCQRSFHCLDVACVTLTRRGSQSSVWAPTVTLFKIMWEHNTAVHRLNLLAPSLCKRSCDST